MGSAGIGKNRLASRGSELARARAGQRQVLGFLGHFLLWAKITDASSDLRTRVRYGTIS